VQGLQGLGGGGGRGEIKFHGDIHTSLSRKPLPKIDYFNKYFAVFGTVYMYMMKGEFGSSTLLCQKYYFNLLYSEFHEILKKVKAKS